MTIETRTIETTTPPTTITYDDLFAILFPAPVRGHLRLVAGSGAETFYRRVGDQWVEQRGERGRGIDAFLASQGGWDVSFSPVLMAAPVAPSPLQPLTCVWAGIRLGLLTQQRHEPRPRLLLESEDEARARLAALAPTAVIHEGDRMTALWRLPEPLADLSRARSLLWRLVRQVDGDPALADPATALIGVPGVRTTAIYPSRVVTVEAWSPTADRASKGIGL